MFQWEELSPKCIGLIYLVILFIVFSSITTCGAVIIKVRVGKKAILIFKYPCDSTKITLQHSNKPPFYNSNNQSLIPYPPNYFVVHQNDTARNECSLHLTVNPVSRNNEGSYMLIPYKNGAILPDYPRIGLRLDYPPGKASCEINNDYNNGEWVSLQCTAPVGTLPGQIACYQNDIRLPEGNKLKESGGNLNQIILARLDNVVYCCSSFLTEMKDMCDCTDWGWNTMSDNVSDIADPCPQVVSTEVPTSTHIVTNPSSPNLATAFTKYPENHKNNFNWKVICTLITVIFILAIITVSIACNYVLLQSKGIGKTAK